MVLGVKSLEEVKPAVRFQINQRGNKLLIFRRKKLSTKQSLEGYQIVKHNFQIWENDGIHTLFIPEYGVFTKNADLNEGYKELIFKKEKYFLKLNEAGISPDKLFLLISKKIIGHVKGFVYLLNQKERYLSAKNP